MRYRNLFVAFVVGVVFLVGGKEARGCFGYGDTWYEDDEVQGIVNVGQVSKTSPADCVHLHYAKTGNPETAHFAIDLTNATDVDRRKRYEYYPPEEPEDGTWTGEWLDGNMLLGTEWNCDGTGEMIPQLGNASIYHPGDAVETEIQVRCIVDDVEFEGYYDDEAVTRAYFEKLKTFKVGVAWHITDSDVYFEDDTESELVIRSLDGFGTLANTCITDPPTVGNFSNEKSWRRDVWWKAVAYTSTGEITGIQQHVKFRPRIDVVGGFSVDAWSNGRPCAVILTQIILAFGGVAGNPVVGTAYKAADVVQKVCNQSNVYTRADAYVAGNSVIENVEARSVEFKKVFVRERVTPVPVVYLVPLSVGNVVLFEKPNVVTHGSIEMETMAGGSDHGLLNWFETDIQPYGASQYVEFYLSRPSYDEKPEPPEQ